MKKLSTVDGNVAMTLDKLPAIQGDLVQNKLSDIQQTSSPIKL